MAQPQAVPRGSMEQTPRSTRVPPWPGPGYTIGCEKHHRLLRRVTLTLSAENSIVGKRVLLNPLKIVTTWMFPTSQPASEFLSFSSCLAPGDKWTDHRMLLGTSRWRLSTSKMASVDPSGHFSHLEFISQFCKHLVVFLNCNWFYHIKLWRSLI